MFIFFGVMFRGGTGLLKEFMGNYRQDYVLRKTTNRNLVLFLTGATIFLLLITFKIIK